MNQNHTTTANHALFKIIVDHYSVIEAELLSFSVPKAEIINLLIEACNTMPDNACKNQVDALAVVDITDFLYTCKRLYIGRSLQSAVAPVLSEDVCRGGSFLSLDEAAQKRIIGLCLRELRLKAGYTQEAIQTQTKVCIKRYETGQTMPQTKNLFYLLRFLNCSLFTFSRQLELKSAMELRVIDKNGKVF